MIFSAAETNSPFKIQLKSDLACLFILSLAWEGCFLRTYPDASPKQSESSQAFVSSC